MLEKLLRRLAAGRRGATPGAEERIHPMSYAFPAELMVAEVPAKRRVWAEVVPGLPETYRFGPDEEEAYYRQYREARFGLTWKKGGWDCLRHYEILANGAIPVFRGLRDCPDRTLVAFPKKLVLEAMDELVPWDESKVELYDHYAARLLAHTRSELTCTSLAHRFLSTMGFTSARPKVLVLTCHRSANYSREMLVIGLKRLSECVEFPRMPYLYEDFPPQRLSELAGLGFGYARRLPPEESGWTRRQVRDSIRAGEWDLVVYGKMGLDERRAGSVPGAPFWADVSASYTADRIAFLYGGDGLQTLSDHGDPYTEHLLRHSRLGQCFVRELA